MLCLYVVLFKMNSSTGISLNQKVTQLSLAYKSCFRVYNMFRLRLGLLREHQGLRQAGLGGQGVPRIRSAERTSTAQVSLVTCEINCLLPRSKFSNVNC